MAASDRSGGLVALLFSGRGLATLAAVLGIACIAVGAIGMRDNRMLARYLTAPGVIVKTTVDQRRIREDGKRKVVYVSRILYEFAVDGTTYQGAWVYPKGTWSFLGRGSPRRHETGTRHGTRGAAERLTTRYPKGKSVDVHYDPNNPDRAFLVKVDYVGLPALVGGVVLLLAGAIGFFLARPKESE